MMKAKFEFDKMITYWNKDMGAGVKVDGTYSMNHWTTSADHLNKVVRITSVEDVQGKLESILQAEYMPTDYFAIMEDGRITFNTLEDGEGNVLDGEQADELHEEGKQVYLCDYNVYVEIQHVYEPTTTQLQAMFPKADF